MWQNIKDWFKHSETILLARLETLFGFIMMSLSAIDWSPMMTLGMDAAMSLKQGLVIGSIMMVKGIATEWARRRNTVEVNSQLIPTSIVKEVKTEITTDLPSVTTTTTDTVSK